MCQTVKISTDTNISINNNQMIVIILNDTHQKVFCSQCKVRYLSHTSSEFCVQWYIWFIRLWLAGWTIIGYTVYILTGAPGHSDFTTEQCAAQCKMSAFYSKLMTFSLSWGANSYTLLAAWDWSGMQHPCLWCRHQAAWCFSCETVTVISRSPRLTQRGNHSAHWQNMYSDHPQLIQPSLVLLTMTPLVTPSGKLQ